MGIALCLGFFGATSAAREIDDPEEADPPALEWPGDPAGFTLGLDTAQPEDDCWRTQRWGLSPLALPQLRPSPVEQAPDAHSIKLNLTAVAPPVGTGAGLVEGLQDELWPLGISRLQVHLGSEHARLLSGGTVGSGESAACLLNLTDLVRWIKSTRRRARERRLASGDRVPLDGRMTLAVREADGQPPETISVLPMTLGRVLDALTVSCDGAGLCRIASLPVEPCTLLVRGSGAALISVPGPGLEMGARLSPAGVLRVELGEGADATEVRISAVVGDREVVVPVSRLQNPGRSEWVRVPPSGLPLLLPEGVYAVQIRTAVGVTQARPASVAADAITVLPIP